MYGMDAAKFDGHVSGTSLAESFSEHLNSLHQLNQRQHDTKSNDEQ